MEIGTYLRETREEKGISLDSLQEKTKIQKRYLQAIEDGNFHLLPGKFYAKAFIKEYANAVGLDAAELLIDHQSEIPTADENDSVEYKQTRRSRHSSTPAKSSTVFSLIPSIVVVLLVIGIIFVAWTLYEKSVADSPTNPTENQDNDSFIRDSEDEKEEEEDTNSTLDPDGNSEGMDDEENTDESEPEVTDPEFNLIEQGTGNSPESTLELNNVGENIQVKLTFTGDAYLQIVNGNNESLLEGMYDENDSPTELDVSGEDKIYLNIGNTKSLSISINEIELEYPASSVHQRLWINFNKTE